MHPTTTHRPVVATLTTIFGTLSQIEADTFTHGDADPACQGRFTFDPDCRFPFDPPWRVEGTAGRKARAGRAIR